MKKAYLKPQLAVENFSLSQTIASGCHIMQGSAANQANGDVCSFTYYGVTLLNSTLSCEADPTTVPQICYNNPDATKAIFYS